MRLPNIDADELDTVTGGQASTVPDFLGRADQCHALATSLRSKETSLNLDQAVREENFKRRVSQCGDAAVSGFLAPRATNEPR
jgi:hypothetical protein